MDPLRVILKPEYFFNPAQVFQRLQLRRNKARKRTRLAWGLPLRVYSDCYVSFSILCHGVFDVIVPEAICRLLDSGELALDVGANVGQNTSMMALVAGRNGGVMAFEPHPAMLAILQQNVVLWREYDLAPITLAAQALDARPGSAFLYESDDFPFNTGAASLEVPPCVVARHEVSTTTLDSVVPLGREVALAKIDVEGHEAAVLQGGTDLLRSGRMRDLIFEDLHPDSSGVVQLLTAAGYTVFALASVWSGPRLIPWSGKATCQLPEDFTHNFLATLVPERACSRFQRRGWRALRLRARKSR